MKCHNWHFFTDRGDDKICDDQAIVGFVGAGLLRHTTQNSSRNKMRDPYRDSIIYRAPNF